MRGVVCRHVSRHIMQRLRGASPLTVLPRTVSTSELVGETMKTSFRRKLMALEGFGEGRVTLEKDEGSGVATVTLDNPHKKNAMTASMMCDLHDIVDDLWRWESGRGIIMRGAGGTFCSGGDLRFVSQLMTPHLGTQMSLFMTKTLARYYRLPMVSVALVQGLALGGGAELCLASDFRLMEHDAKIGFIHAQMGVTTGWGGGSRLIKLVGPATALHLLTSASKVAADTALSLGLTTATVPPGEDPVTRAREFLLEHNSTVDTKVLRSIKMLVSCCSESASPEESVNVERDVFYQTWGGKAHRAAVSNTLTALRRNTLPDD